MLARSCSIEPGGALFALLITIISAVRKLVSPGWYTIACASAVREDDLGNAELCDQPLELGFGMDRDPVRVARSGE